MAHSIISVDVQVQSVAKYIPNDESNDSQFVGIVSSSKAGICDQSGSNDPVYRSRQIEVQKKDAEERVVAWNAESSRWGSEDAEGEDDPDYVNDSGVAMGAPLGLRKSDGTIIPLEEKEAMDMDESETPQFFGRPEVPPSHVRQLASFTSNTFGRFTHNIYSVDER